MEHMWKTQKSSYIGIAYRQTVLKSQPPSYGSLIREIYWDLKLSLAGMKIRAVFNSPLRGQGKRTTLGVSFYMQK